MKIRQRTIWIRCLIIGIIYNLLLNSCDSTTEYTLPTNFIYKNLTSENVNIILYDIDNVRFNNYLIDPGKEIKVSIVQDGGKNGIGQPFAFGNNKKVVAGKVIVKFELSNKCLTFLEGEGILDPRAYDNFNESMYSASNNTLIYSIDNSKLALATPCL